MGEIASCMESILSEDCFILALFVSSYIMVCIVYNHLCTQLTSLRRDQNSDEIPLHLKTILSYQAKSQPSRLQGFHYGWTRRLMTMGPNCDSRFTTKQAEAHHQDRFMMGLGKADDHPLHQRYNAIISSSYSHCVPCAMTAGQGRD